VKNLRDRPTGQGTAGNGEEGVQMLWQELRRPKLEGIEDSARLRCECNANGLTVNSLNLLCERLCDAQTLSAIVWKLSRSVGGGTPLIHSPFS